MAASGLAGGTRTDEAPAAGEAAGRHPRSGVHRRVGGLLVVAEEAPISSVATEAPRARLAGFAWMLLASAAFAVLGAIVKSVSAAGVPTAQIVGWRSIGTSVVVAAIALSRGRSLRPKNLAGHVVRGTVGVLSMGTYFYAVSRLPLGDAVLITYSSPLLVGAFAPLVGEKPPARVWGPLALGLAGVALVAGPAASDDYVGLASALFATFFSAAAYLAVRVLTRTERPDTIVFWFGAVGAVLAAPSFVSGPVVPSGAVVAGIVGLAVVGAIAQTAMTEAYAVGPVAQVSVVQYTTPVFAYLLGLVALGELPRPSSVAGAALVAVAGLLAARV